MSVRAAAFLVFLAASASATAGIVEEWDRKIADSTRALESGDYERSLNLSDGVIKQMIERLGPGSGSTRAFGTVVMHKALALAGLGKHEDALWYWHTALSLYPEFAKADLTAYGEAGTFLAQNAEPRAPSEYNPGEGKPLGPEMTPPKLLDRVMPKFPRGAREFGVDGLLVVQVVITPEGKITSPVIRKALPAATLSYVALEALRRWRFQPATNDGEPIRVIFDLSVNFKL